MEDVCQSKLETHSGFKSSGAKEREQGKDTTEIDASFLKTFDSSAALQVSVDELKHL